MGKAKASRVDFDARKEIDYMRRIESSDVSTDDLEAASVRLGTHWRTASPEPTGAEGEQRKRRAASWELAHACVTDYPMPYPVPSQETFTRRSLKSRAPSAVKKGTPNRRSA